MLSIIGEKNKGPIRGRAFGNSCGDSKSSAGVCSMQQKPGRWIYLEDPSEGAVTFQIGAVGSDGVILASDRSIQKRAGLYRTSAETEKITLCDDVPLAFCCNGDDLAQFAGNLIAEKIRSAPNRPNSAVELQDLLEQCAQEALVSEFRKSFYEDLHGGVVTLTYEFPKRVTLWQMEARDLKDRNQPHATKWDTKITAGDWSTSAVYFLERFYPNSSALLTTSELVGLCAHCILAAGNLAPDRIHGLEIAVCKKDEWRKLPEDRIQELKEIFGEVDDYTRKKLLQAP